MILPAPRLKTNRHQISQSRRSEIVKVLETYQLTTAHAKLNMRTISLFSFCRSLSTIFSTTSLSSPSPGRSESSLSAESLDIRGVSDVVYVWPISSSMLPWSASSGLLASKSRLSILILWFPAPLEAGMAGGWWVGGRK